MFPVEEKLSEIAARLANNRDVVLTAPPGSGKTTCVPPALLNCDWLASKKIIMLEPRRIAARSCAQYIATKLGEQVGETVGYQVRLERRISNKTRLEIVTEGLLTQRLMSDPELSDVGLVIFDEFHERSLQCDLSFALTLEVRRALRPDLRILVMSATLDADAVVSHLGDADLVRAEGRMFPVAVQYLGDMSMSAAISKACKETTGDILCFLPGEAEIRRCAESCRAIAGAVILPLYGSLPKEDQDKVFYPMDARKIILATSIAETSVTIAGISCVIDSGLMRVQRFSPSTGMSGLVTLPLTQDRAEQRKGRAGRVQAGVCYRLWTESEQASRPRQMVPEILDADLCHLVLTSVSWGALGRADLPWLTNPAASLWDQAVALLKLLGALDTAGKITAKGEKMAKMPMHPRLANMMLGGGDPLLAAIIEEGGRCRESDIRYVDKSGRVKQLAKRFEAYTSGHIVASEGAMLSLAYPDRVAKNRGNGTFRMVNGRGAFLPEDDPMSKSPYVVCCELDDRQGDARIFLGCPITEAEVLSLFGDKIVEHPYCEWDRRTDSVKSVLRGTLGELVVYEKPSRDDSSLQTALVEGVRIKGVENLPCWTKSTRQLRERNNFLHRQADLAWPEISDAAILNVLEGFVGGMSKWKDLERLDIAAVIDFIVTEAGHTRRELDQLAPVTMEVPSGSNMTIHYDGDEPRVEVRLQECFGLMNTPKVAGGRIPILMTLLSPAQRPIQVTKDLAGFWKGAYQLVRKDMRGRYPKHYWPEDPFTAVATNRVRPKLG